MKRCTKCDRLLPLASFNRRSRSRDGLQPNCRACTREWHRLRRSTPGNPSREAKVRNYRLLRDYLVEHPCVDCGETDLLVLEFDHVGNDKVMNVSLMVVGGFAWEKIEAEIAKCDVVCANCHRRRTQQRGGFVRSHW